MRAVVEDPDAGKQAGSRSNPEPKQRIRKRKKTTSTKITLCVGPTAKTVQGVALGAKPASS